VKPDEVQILLDQARLALDKGDFEEAHTLVGRILKEEGDLPEALNLKALIFFKDKKYQQAKELFLTLSRKFPGEPAIILNLGISALKLEEWHEALEYLHRAQELMPNNPKIHNYLGLAYSGLGQFGRAQEEFIKGGSKKMADQMLALLRSGETTPPSPSLSFPEEEEIRPTPRNDLETAIDEAFQPTPSPPPPAGEPSPSPQDLVGQALQLLRSRYELFVEIHESGKALRELSQRISLRSDWERPVGVVERGILGIEIHPQRLVAVRIQNLLAFKGDLSLSPLSKRYKGKDLKAPFGTPDDPLYLCQGSGELYLLPPKNHQFFLIKLEKDLLYIREEFLYGIFGSLEWENGRLPSPRPPEPQVAQIRGEGYAILIYPSKGSLKIIPTGGQKSSVPIQNLIGWFGQAIPIVQEWGKDATRIVVVQFQGDGSLLLHLPYPSD
jgi:hypothetical protein